MGRERVKILQVYRTDYPRTAGGVDVVVANLLGDADGRYAADLLRTAAWTTRGLAVRQAGATRVLELHLPELPSGTFALRAWLFFLTRAPVAAWRLLRLLRRDAYDLVHLHTLQAYHAYFLLARALGGPPFVVTLHRAEVLAYPERRGLKGRIWTRTLEHAAGVNAVSGWLAEQARGDMPRPERIRVIHSGIDDALPVLPDAAEIRERQALPARYCAALGTLAPYKGHAVAVRAWAALGEALGDVALVLVGAGPLEAELRALGADLGLGARLRFTGHLPREDALAVARDAMAVVMPSLNEGQGLAVLEAGLVRTPLVCSDIGPFTEMVADGETALVFPSGDADALAHCVRRLHDDPALAAGLSERFAELVRSEYSVAGMRERYATFYEEALAATGDAEARS